MKIIEVKENKKQYLDLLLLADEQEDISSNKFSTAQIFYVVQNRK